VLSQLACERVRLHCVGLLGGWLLQQRPELALAFCCPTPPLILPPHALPCPPLQPWFHLFLGGELRSSFSANLATVAQLRAEIAAAKACLDPGCAVY